MFDNLKSKIRQSKSKLIDDNPKLETAPIYTITYVAFNIMSKVTDKMTKNRSRYVIVKQEME
jgi:hypothetical protein